MRQTWVLWKRLRIPVMAEGGAVITTYDLWVDRSRRRTRWAVTTPRDGTTVTPAGDGCRSPRAALEPVRIAFGDWLRRYRDAAGISQEDLADRVGCRALSVSRWERGVAMPSRRMLEAITELAIRDGFLVR